MKYILSIILLGTSVSAQQACAPRDVVLQNLKMKYNETRQSMGLGADNSVIEIFASEETGSWTIITTLPNGITCMVAAGQAFEEMVAEVEPNL